MTHFEPESPKIPQQWDERLARLESHYTDEELLLELRRRGRFARVEAEHTVPQFLIDGDYPIENQIYGAWRQIAQEAFRQHIAGVAPTGATVENVTREKFPGSPLEQGRRVRFALNYVIDRRK